MKKREFKSESKRLLDLMINSIYTNKDIFLRELISNASDAIDKLYYKSLTDDNIKVDRESLEININYDKELRTITISDNGCGMTESELENNPYVKAIVNKELPLSIGGGIGQSRICMFLLQKAHIGEVQASVWKQEEVDLLAANNIHLL
mgnify:CR=1 FL=1